MLPDIRDYDRLKAAFRWAIPARYNIGTAVCDRWAAADPQRIAIIEAGADGTLTPVSYETLRQKSNRLAHALTRAGIAAGARIAIMLPQCHQVAVAHIAAYKMGAIALPLAILFGVDAVEYRLHDAGVSVVITNAAGLAKLRQITRRPASLRLVISIDGDDRDARDFDALMARESADFRAVDSLADDPALMIYTSGTTGHPKGALHGHRVLLGHLPGVQMPHEFLPQPGDRLWTPADWAWAGGLLNVLLPGLHFGVPVVARKFEKFDPEDAFRLIQDADIRNTFIPPTALRMLRTVKNPRSHYQLNLRTLASGGESLGEPTFVWGRDVLGLTINEFYGQTECNLVLASCAAMGVAEGGAIGKAVPGHTVAIIRDNGSVCEPGERGQIAILRPNPVMFLSYWNNEKATQEKYIGDWLATGDQGTMDAQGYVRFVGRDDDIITSSGYRIGPVEIEDCLIRHPAVALAAAIGKPDPVRTEIVKAFLVLKPGYAPSPALTADIQAFVRERLSAHEYPREIACVDALPLTTTGKVIRRILRDTPPA
ncbi:MAG: AMP-binding protein [Beijerinckiaceae bacterium]